jgi:putative OPT family oligopeptide transporter
MKIPEQKEQKEQKAFTVRAVVVGVILSVVVCMYSAYAGLKVGGVYWPIITATIMSFALLKLFGGKTNKNEVNVAATAASTGGLLAAGIIFTVPAIWLLGLNISVAEVTFIAIVGGLLGVLFTIPLREEMIEKLKLPYPDGTATAKVLEAGDEGGKKAKTVFAFFGLAGLFTIIRDYFRLFPSFWNLDSLKLSAAKYFSLGSSISLVPFSGGFLIGLKFTALWFAGAFASYFVIVPALVSYGLFADKVAAIMTVTKPFGIGVIIGASIIYFLIKGLPAFVPMLKGAWKSEKRGKWWALALIIFAALLSFDYGPEVVHRNNLVMV